jgi:HSP20 family protein
MMPTRYSIPGMDRFSREMNHVLNNIFDAAPFVTGQRSFPAINVWEDGERLFAEAEVPGLSMEDMEIYVVGNELTIKGHRKTPEDGRRAFHRRERGTGEFSRVLTLPVEVNAEKVEATLKDGVLTVTMPKAESARPRKISIKAS